MLRDALDEPVPCLALSFSPDGATLRVAAQKRSRLAAFDVATSQYLGRGRRATRAPRVSCVRRRARLRLRRLPGQIRVYDDRENDPGVALKDSNKMGGVTRLRVSDDAVSRRTVAEDVVRGFDLRTRRVASRCTRPATRTSASTSTSSAAPWSLATPTARCAFDLEAADVDIPGSVLVSVACGQRRAASRATGMGPLPTQRSWLVRISVVAVAAADRDCCRSGHRSSGARSVVYRFLLGARAPLLGAPALDDADARLDDARMRADFASKGLDGDAGRRARSRTPASSRERVAGERGADAALPAGARLPASSPLDSRAVQRSRSVRDASRPRCPAAVAQFSPTAPPVATTYAQINQ